MSNANGRVTALDVIQFFKSADLEVAELALHVATTVVEGKVATRKAASDRMAKARAGRKPRAVAGSPAQAEAPANAQAQPHRAQHTPAPAHTAAATSVASD